MYSLLKTYSWVIVEKESGKAILETFNESITSKVNLSKYNVMPILQYLQSLNYE